MSLEDALKKFYYNEGWKQTRVEVSVSFGDCESTTLNLEREHFAQRKKFGFLIEKKIPLSDGLKITFEAAARVPHFAYGSGSRKLSAPYEDVPFELSLGPVCHQTLKKEEMSRGNPYRWQPVSWLTIPIERGPRGVGFVVAGTVGLDFTDYYVGNNAIYDETTPWLRDLTPTWHKSQSIVTAEHQRNELKRLSALPTPSIPFLWRVNEEAYRCDNPQ